MKLLQLTFTIFLCFMLCSCLNRVAGSKQVVEIDGHEIWVYQIKGENSYEATHPNAPGISWVDTSAKKRNILAIEEVTGGTVDRDTINSKVYTTYATVIPKTENDSNSSN